ncbi:hypothetical protein SCB49_11492 [unidentified eubacterium SCB49]|nr:hypothetical protein SCB49_11492 [unidentified eubacterium SCB49]
MKHLLKSISILFFFLFSTSAVFGQIEYESGYYINNQNVKVSGLIENVGWKNNPSKFNFKETENAPAQTINITEAKEFFIADHILFVRAKVKIDHSNTINKGLDRNRDPDFVKKTLYLKKIIEGDHDLFSYNEGNLFRLFFEDKLGEIKQLVYRKYSPNNYKIMVNEQYKQQLFNTLKCDDISLNDFDSLEYTLNDISKIFIKYNECKNVNYKHYNVNTKEDVFNLTVRPRVSFSSLDVSNSLYEKLNLNFEDQTFFSFGVEAEFILNFNRKKWSVFIEPTYQHFKAESPANVANLEGTASIDYKSIEIPLGLRHYLFLNKKSKLFVNAAFIVDKSLNSSITFAGESNGIALEQEALKLKTNPNIALGIGYNYDSKYSMELRYHTKREVLESYVFYNSDFNNISFILGYTLF